MKISGPVIMATFHYEDKFYYLFGDDHADKKNNCSDNCQDIEINTLKHINNNNKNCIDITRYLESLFFDAYRRDEIVDFYIETSFMSEDLLSFQSSNISYLAKTINTFENCIYKSETRKECPYSNVRFHYTDLRSTKRIKGKFRPLLHDYIQIQLKFFAQLQNSLQKKIFVEFVKWFYGVNDISSHIKNYDRPDVDLFLVYINSDNYINDVDQIFKKYKGEMPKNIFDILYDPKFVVKRRNKVMHKIRAQLEALEFEELDDIAFKIRNYIYNRYLQTTDNFDEILNDMSVNNIPKLPKRPISLLMDCYTLARIFRTYPNTNHTNSNTVIIYTGYSHTLEYINFFRRVLNVKMKINPENEMIDSNSPNRCLNL